MDLNLIQLNNNNRVKVINKFGYDLDSEGYVVDNKRKRVICKYSKEEVHINTAAILPGSFVIINANPITMAEYFLDIETQDD